MWFLDDVDVGTGQPVGQPPAPTSRPVALGGAFGATLESVQRLHERLGLISDGELAAAGEQLAHLGDMAQRLARTLAGLRRIKEALRTDD
jgi:hypothetical protein